MVSCSTSSVKRRRGAGAGAGGEVRRSYDEAERRSNGRGKGGRRRACRVCAAGVNVTQSAQPSTVLVAGATGGVGQLVTAKLLQTGYNVRAMTRDADKARSIFADSAEVASTSGGGSNLSIVVADGRFEGQVAAAFGDGGVSAVIDCTGTTAFPSTRWRDGGAPPSTSVIVRNLVSAALTAAKGAQEFSRYVFVSSIGVERRSSFPFRILDLFGALEHKSIAEAYIRESGLPYTIFRAARLTDGTRNRTIFSIRNCLGHAVRPTGANAGTRHEHVVDGTKEGSDDDLPFVSAA